jgi:hypothetical protein
MNEDSSSKDDNTVSIEYEKEEREGRMEERGQSGGEKSDKLIHNTPQPR